MRIVYSDEPTFRCECGNQTHNEDGVCDECRKVQIKKRVKEGQNEIIRKEIQNNIC